MRQCPSEENDMSGNLKSIMNQLDSLTREGHYQAAMAVVQEAQVTFPAESPEGKELAEAMEMLIQMAQMAQFAKELGIGPGGSQVQEYSPDWTPPTPESNHND